MPDRPANETDTRDQYPHGIPIATRWNDTDLFGHVNNAVYYEYFDSVIHRYLMEAGGNDPLRGETLQFCVENRCQYHRELSFPETVDARLRVAKLGRSSVCFELGLFTEANVAPAASGYFVHVFVDRSTHKPMPIPDPIRAALQRLLVPDVPSE